MRPKGSDGKIDGNRTDRKCIAFGPASAAALGLLPVAHSPARFATSPQASDAALALSSPRTHQSCKQLQKCFRIRESYRIVNTRHVAWVCRLRQDAAAGRTPPGPWVTRQGRIRQAAA